MKSKHIMWPKSIEKIVDKENFQVRVAYRTFKTQAFFHNKDRVSKNLQSNLVYVYNCDHCVGHKYIGETRRHFITRKEEHLKGNKGETEIFTHHHKAQKENFPITIRTNHTFIGESLVYHSVPSQFRLNKYHPPYRLKLFHCDVSCMQ